MRLGLDFWAGVEIKIKAQIDPRSGDSPDPFFGDGGDRVFPIFRICIGIAFSFPEVWGKVPRIAQTF